MRSSFLFAILLCASVACHSQEHGLKEGDIVFQKSMSGQGKFISVATHSPYTHCGMLFLVGGQWQVLEAVEPVKFTPLKEWIARGMEGKYVVKRLKNAQQVLTPDVLTKMRQEGSTMLKKHYDLFFGWGDDKLYCSELVWKIYKHNTNIELGNLQKLKQFDLTNEGVKKAMVERYGNKIPYEENVISPAAIFDSPLLIEVQTK